MVLVYLKLQYINGLLPWNSSWVSTEHYYNLNVAKKRETFKLLTKHPDYKYCPLEILCTAVFLKLIFAEIRSDMGQSTTSSGNILHVIRTWLERSFGNETERILGNKQKVWHGFTMQDVTDGVVNKHVNVFCCLFSFPEDASVMETGRSRGAGVQLSGQCHVQSVGVWGRVCAKP